MNDDKQRQAQQKFHDNQLQATLDEAKQGKRTVLFVDAAHFVMGAFLEISLDRLPFAAESVGNKNVGMFGDVPLAPVLRREYQVASVLSVFGDAQ